MSEFKIKIDSADNEGVKRPALDEQIETRLQKEAISSWKEMLSLTLVAASSGVVRAATDFSSHEIDKSLPKEANALANRNAGSLGTSTDFVQKASVESAARAEHITARSALENAREAMTRHSAVPDRLKADLRQLYADLRQSGAGEAPLRTVTKQAQFVETMTKNSPRLTAQLLKEASGTAEQVARGQKVFLENSPRHSMIESYGKAMTEGEKACFKYTESLHAVEQAQSARLAAAESKTANTLMEASSKSVALKGLLRGTAALGATAGGLYAADMAVRRIGGEEIALSNYKISPLMQPNLVDAFGVGILSTDKMPLKFRIAGYAASTIAGRASNAVSEFLIRQPLSIKTSRPW